MSTLTQFTDDDWDELLLYVRNKQVIPVVGPELVTVEDKGGQVPLTRWLAPRLAEHLKLERPATPVSLNDVACTFLLGGGARQKVYTGIRLLLQNTRFDPAPALLQIAQITDFDLFISTTFDGLLSLAMEKARPGFTRSRDVLVYDTKPATPFPDPLPGSLVYHILGNLSTFPDLVVWEEDYMEYLCALVAQNGDKALEGLFRQLRNRHLLLLGAPFGDWIVRFFIRAARGQRLSDPREHGTGEYLADQTVNVGEPTVFFFNNLAKATRVIQGDPTAFVAELFARWEKSRDVSGSTQDFLVRLSTEMPKGAVFISYSRSDSETATRLGMRLAAANIPVWLDKERLHAGANYERNLEHAVRDSCSFFISLISANTEADVTRYVHKERAWAASRFQDGFVFYLPVVIDNTRSVDVKLEPACFTKIHRERFPGGAPTEEFIQRLRFYLETWRTSGRPRD